jgi:hypothetical protein
MMVLTKNMKSIAVVAGFLLVSVGAFAAGKKIDGDTWSWRWMGSVENAGHMFPNTNVAKFTDTSNGVVCYVYSSNNATSVTLMTNGAAKEGVNGSEIGTMSCVAERR